MYERGRIVRIHIAGTSPYGFRLVSNSQGQIVVTKLRAKSKAFVAGLIEGDIITAVNGYNCEQVSHDRVMSLVEHAGHYLDVDVLRTGSSSANTWSNNFLTSQKSRDWDEYSYENSAADSPSFDMFASSYEHENSIPMTSSPYDTLRSSNFDNVETEVARFGGTLFSPSPRFDARHPQNIGDNVASFRWNPDRSVTMSLQLTNDNKENRVPAATHRNETFLLVNSPSPPPVSRRNVWQPSIPVRSHSVQPVTSLNNDDLDLGHSYWQDTYSDSEVIDPPQKFGQLPPQVAKILTASSDADNIEAEMLNKKKKAFADSSFFNDPKHSYPTVEEQIKMARKVALSLMAPVNQSTRGHQMFMKRKQKLDIDEENNKSNNVVYNPTPWNSGALWRPTSAPPAAPPLSIYSAASVIPLYKDDKAMSTEEFERVRMFSQKSTHDTVHPQVCFNLANDLRQSNSKGGRMFAKRRARADQYTVENNPKQPERVKDKIFVQYAMNQMSKVPEPNLAPPPSNDVIFQLPQLQAELRRARMTPWDAAVEYSGNVDPAFDHLSDLTFVKSPPASTSAVRPQFSTGVVTTKTQHITTSTTPSFPSVTSFAAGAANWTPDGSSTKNNNQYKPVRFNAVGEL